jgi:hypothetical protein
MLYLDSISKNLLVSQLRFLFGIIYAAVPSTKFRTCLSIRPVMSATCMLTWCCMNGDHQLVLLYAQKSDNSKLPANKILLRLKSTPFFVINYTHMLIQYSVFSFVYER